jgi:hypothetical protein
MRFVHSRCKLGLFLGGYALDSRCDLRCIIEPGEFVLLWSIFLHVLLDVLHQIVEAFPFMVPCTLVVYITEHPLNRVGPRTVRRQPEHLKTGVACQPLFDGFRFMNTVVICDHIEARKLSSRVRGVQQGQELPKQRVVVTRTEAIEQLASGEMQRPSEIVRLILPWRHDLGLRALRHPSRPDLGQEVNTEFIRKDHHLMRLQVFVMKPNTRQTVDPVRVVIFGHQLGPFPHPAYLVEPASYRFRRHLDAVFGLERRRECSITPWVRHQP